MMKQVLLFSFFLFCVCTVSAQDDTFENKWLVVFSSSETYEQAADQSPALSIKTKILNTSDYDNLNPGWYIHCLPFEKKEEAVSFSSFLKESGKDHYLKYSGNNKSKEEYLLEHHSLIYHSYMFTDYTIEKEEVVNVLGYVGSAIYLATATVEHASLPIELQSMVNKEVVIYDKRGTPITATITGFLAASLVIPHWNWAIHWRENGVSELEKAENLLTNDLSLVAKLDIPQGFQGLVAHRKGGKQFLPYRPVQTDHLEEEIWERYFQSALHKEADSMLKASVAEGNDEDYHFAKGVSAYQVGEDTVVLFYGDYGEEFSPDGYTTTLLGIWYTSTDHFEIEEHEMFNPDAAYYPLFSPKGDSFILGMINGGQTFFHQSGWKFYSTLGLRNYDCPY
ncbi:MAG: hypothetical protein AAF587_31930 [Bacteroidota bacterium]